MNTQILSATDKNIALGASLIREGQLVAFPTETVYGLGANALDEQAVGAIFEAKGRPTADPLIVHIASLNELENLVVGMDDLALSLAERFWPGPLTLVLPKTEQIPDLVTSGLGNVAIRMPSHPVALKLIRLAGVPVAAPSANLFGHTSPTTAEHVAADLNGKIPLILDGGATMVGVESTVAQVMEGKVRILRTGGISREEIELVAGEVSVMNYDREAIPGLPSPGLLAKHYSPYAEMIYLTGKDSRTELLRIAKIESRQQNVGILISGHVPEEIDHENIKVAHLGNDGDLATIARNIYAGLRWLDQQGVNRIYCHDFPETGIGAAIRDRLRRAATRVI